VRRVGLADATTAVLAVFTAAGMRATDDARDINPPCIYLVPPAGSLRFDRHRAEVTWTAYLVTGDAGARAATRALSELVDQVAGTLPITTFERRALPVPGGGDPLPAYEITWKSTVPIGAPTP
jgi:hypothetical protein